MIRYIDMEQRKFEVIFRNPGRNADIIRKILTESGVTQLRMTGKTFKHGKYKIESAMIYCDSDMASYYEACERLDKLPIRVSIVRYA